MVSNIVVTISKVLTRKSASTTKIYKKSSFYKLQLRQTAFHNSHRFIYRYTYNTVLMWGKKKQPLHNSFKFNGHNNSRARMWRQKRSSPPEQSCQSSEVKFAPPRRRLYRLYFRVSRETERATLQFACNKIKLRIPLSCRSESCSQFIAARGNGRSDPSICIYG